MNIVLFISAVLGILWALGIIFYVPFTFNRPTNRLKPTAWITGVITMAFPVIILSLNALGWL